MILDRLDIGDFDFGGSGFFGVVSGDFGERRAKETGFIDDARKFFDNRVAIELFRVGDADER